MPDERVAESRVPENLRLFPCRGPREKGCHRASVIYRAGFPHDNHREDNGLTHLLCRSLFRQKCLSLKISVARLLRGLVGSFRCFLHLGLQRLLRGIANVNRICPLGVRRWRCWLRNLIGCSRRLSGLTAVNRHAGLHQRVGYRVGHWGAFFFLTKVVGKNLEGFSEVITALLISA